MTDARKDRVLNSPLPPVAKRPMALIGVIAAIVLTALSGRYGYHRDELYFLAAADRPALGYIDQPPLTPMLAKVSVTLFGNTPMGLRVVATIAFVVTIILVALIARELGAGRTGQILAMCGTAIGGFGLGIAHMVSTSSFDMVAWLALALIALRIMRGGDQRWWLAAGAVGGLAILNKYLVGLLVVTLLVSWLAVGPRHRLRTWWTVAGALVAIVIAGPNLWWQFANDWPQLTVAAGIGSDDGSQNRLMFVPEQLVYLSPVLVPVWVVGWRRLWNIRWARAFAVAYPLLCLIVIATGGKGYYAIPLLLVLMAAGAVPVADWLRRDRQRLSTVLVSLGLGLAGSMVVSLPVLPASALTIPNTVNAEQGEQVGWPELVAAVAVGWDSVEPADQGKAVVFTMNFGQAGAVEEYGPDHGLPAPYSGHMSYADWGPPPDSQTGPVIVVHEDETAMPVEFVDCIEITTVDNGHGVDNAEQGTMISRCELSRPWSTIWPDLQHYY